MILRKNIWEIFIFEVPGQAHQLMHQQLGPENKLEPTKNEMVVILSTNLKFHA